MTAQIIDGKAIAESLLGEIKAKITNRIASGKRAPCLAVILVGADPASAIYVRNKRLASEKVGILSIAYDLPASTTEVELLELIDKLNNDHTPMVQGALQFLTQQLPGKAYKGYDTHISEGWTR